MVMYVRLFSFFFCFVFGTMEIISFALFSQLIFFFGRLIGTNHMSVKKSRSRCTDKIQNFHSQIIFILYSHLSRKNVWNCGVFFFSRVCTKKNRTGFRMHFNDLCIHMKKKIYTITWAMSIFRYIYLEYTVGWMIVFFWFWFLFCGLIQ